MVGSHLGLAVAPDSGEASHLRTASQRASRVSSENNIKKHYQLSLHAPSPSKAGRCALVPNGTGVSTVKGGFGLDYEENASTPGVGGRLQGKDIMRRY